VDVEEDAWGVLEGIWLRVVKGIGKLHDSQALPAWLYKIAHRDEWQYSRLITSCQLWSTYMLWIVQVRRLKCGRLTFNEKKVGSLHEKHIINN